MNELQQKTARAIVNVFETGRISGDYSAIAVLKGDSGHLSYGRSQATLGSGSLFRLLDMYCQNPDADARLNAQIQGFLPTVRRKDVSLDTDKSFKQLLRDAGEQDPVMRATQDQFFNNGYFAPACTAAEALGITEPLGEAVIYDSHVQGGWAKLRSRMGPVIRSEERAWVAKYIALRTGWLQSLKDPLPTTVYRMESFTALIDAAKWDLGLPLTVHGVQITEAGLSGDAPQDGVAPRTLVLVTPYLYGADVKKVQAALGDTAPDGFYGPFTAQLVSEWQGQHAITETGVGAITRKSLGLSGLTGAATEHK